MDAGLAAGETMRDALREMKNLAVAIAAGTAAGSDVAAYEADFDALIEEYNGARAAATFDGVSPFTAAADAITTGLGATALADLGVDIADTTLTNASTADDVQAEIDSVAASLQTLGTQSKSYERQLTFVSKLQDAIEAGVGNLVDADLAKESARLQALQTKQQLGIQALSIANSASSSILGLFR